MAILNLPEPHPRQLEILKSEARFRVVVCGRRFGKTYIGIRSILIRAVNQNAACWWLAPTYDMADHVWRELKSATRDMKGVRVSESNRRIEFPGGGSLEVHSTFIPDHLRGAGLDFVVLDEAAFMPPEIWPEVVRPMLLERKGRALFLSSPNGKNWFYHLYLLGQHSEPASPSPAVHPTSLLSCSPRPEGEGSGVRVNPADTASAFSGQVRAPLARFLPEPGSQTALASGDITTPDPLPQPPFSSSPLHRYVRWGGARGGVKEPDAPLWQSWRFPSSENPLIDPLEFDAIRLETPERIWRAEYDAEFTDDSGQVFRGIQEVATAPVDAQPVPDKRYVLGVDWGRENDYTAIVVMDAESHSVVALDRFNQIGWSLQRGRLAALCERWKPVAIWAEANSIGSPNIEALQREGLPVRAFQTTAASKPPLIESLVLAIERRELTLLPDETLLGELAAYTLERLPSSGFRYTAPPGLHDDLVIALALAWHGARFSSPMFSFV